MNNFTNNRWLTVITLLLLTANIVTLTLLWTNKSNDKQQTAHPPPGGPVFEFLTRELNLDAAQQETYRTLRNEHQQAIRPLQDSIREAKDEFFGLLQQPLVTDTMIQEFSARIGMLEQRRDVVTLLHFQKLRAICNATQKKQFDDVIREALRRMGGPKKPPGPPPGMEDEDMEPPPHE